MRNAHDNAAEGQQTDEGTPEVYSSGASGLSRRRKRAVIGAVGLVSILGAAGLVADRVLDDRDTGPGRTSQTGALEPIAPVPAAPSSVSGEPSTGARTGPGSPVPPPVGTTATTRPRTDAERIAAARAAAAKSKSQVRRPMPNTGVAAAVSETDVTTSTVQRNGETLRIMSARADLTGYRELGWIVDGGTKVGDVLCTQTIRLSADVAARERPTLLLCWRTSAQKSVYTIATTVTGRPSMPQSAAAIDAEWAKLG
jgi:hypothetical protein